MAKNKEGGLVYSTEAGGKTCPECRHPLDQCQCTIETRSTSSDGTIRIQRETKGRKGKGVTLITGLDLPEKDLKALAKTLKAKCGTGGTIREGIIEIQGDHRDTLLTELEKKGWKAKKAGG